MTDLVNKVRENFENCIVERKISKDGCDLKLTGAPAPEDRVIVDFDEEGSPLGKNASRCDYLYVARSVKDGDWVAPIELKKGEAKRSQVIKQLQAGASVIQDVITPKTKIRLRPVLASGQQRSLNQRELREWKINFRGKPVSIRRASCGQRLVDALE